METTPLFSYGSNSKAQLRARCQSPALKSFPAYLDDYVRIFAGSSSSWGGGGVATLAKHPGGRLFGSLVHLNTMELERLSRFEYGYSKVTLLIFDMTTNLYINAVCYIKDTNHFMGPPSEPYRMAVHCHLKENFPSDPCTLTIRYIQEDGAIRTLEDWIAPPFHALSIEAFLVLVNNHSQADSLWVMPARITEVVDKLQAIDVRTTSDLGDVLCRNADDAINDMLLRKSKKAFYLNTLHVMRLVLRI